MLKGQAGRLLRSLAALFVLAATLVLPAVSHGSVVDQYTEERPAPGGNVPTKPSREVVRPGGGSGSSGDVGAIFGEGVAGNGGGLEERSLSGGAGESGVSGGNPTSGEVESSGAPGGMGALFPAALFVALAMSFGFTLRGGLGRADGGSSR